MKATCPKCHVNLSVDDKLFGKRITCPSCKQSVRLNAAAKPVPVLAKVPANADDAAFDLSAGDDEWNTLLETADDEWNKTRCSQLRKASAPAKAKKESRTKNPAKQRYRFLRRYCSLCYVIIIVLAAAVVICTGIAVAAVLTNHPEKGLQDVLGILVSGAVVLFVVLVLYWPTLVVADFLTAIADCGDCLMDKKS
jgi:cation transport ATPase